MSQGNWKPIFETFRQRILVIGRARGRPGDGIGALDKKFVVGDHLARIVLVAGGV